MNPKDIPHQSTIIHVSPLLAHQRRKIYIQNGESKKTDNYRVNHAHKIYIGVHKNTKIYKTLSQPLKYSELIKNKNSL